MYWDTLTATGVYISIMLTIAVVYLSGRTNQAGPRDADHPLDD